MGRFEANPHLEDELRRSRFVRDQLAELADEGAKRYHDTVPVETGKLRDSIFSDVALTATGYAARVGATDWKAALVEFGTTRHAPDGSLRRAVESLGARFEETHQ